MDAFKPGIPVFIDVSTPWAVIAGCTRLCRHTVISSRSIVCVLPTVELRLFVSVDTWDTLFIVYQYDTLHM